MLLQKILKTLIKKTCSKPTQSRNVEDILYPSTVYPIYACTQQAFNYCIKNKLMKRDDILYMKEMLNGFVNPNYYKNITFKNDIHEIYKKLKSHDISVKQMKKLLDFVNQFVIVIPEPIKTIQHLRVLK